MYQAINTTELEKLMKEENIHVIDVREQDEYEAGHIPGVTHLPLSGFPDNIPELENNQKHYLICASGGRSGMAAEHLSKRGYEAVNVEGGMGTWEGNIE